MACAGLVALMSSGCASHPDTTPAHPTPPQTGRCNAPPQARVGARTVVFALSAAGTQTLANGKTRATGFFLGEFYEAYRAVTDAGYEVVIATPDGRAPVVDPESRKPDYWSDHPQWLPEAEAMVRNDPRLSHPVSLAHARSTADGFDGVIVPGGQGVMHDLIDDPDLLALVATHADRGRVVGLICHAPALLARLPEHNALSGRTVTSVSAAEELYIERFVMHGRATDRRIGRSLQRRGFTHRARFPGKPHAVRDGTLVTSQNPFSGDAFARHLVAALDDRAQRAKADCP